MTARIAAANRTSIAAPAITFGIWVAAFAWIMIRFA